MLNASNIKCVNDAHRIRKSAAHTSDGSDATDKESDSNVFS